MWGARRCCPSWRRSFPVVADAQPPAGAAERGGRDRAPVPGFCAVDPGSRRCARHYAIRYNRLGGSRKDILSRGALDRAAPDLEVQIYRAGSEPKLGAQFTNVELNRSFCDERHPIIAATPKFKLLWKAVATRPEPRRIGRSVGTPFANSRNLGSGNA